MPNFRNLMSGDSGGVSLVEVENSALFNSANSEDLSRGSMSGTATTWTASFWVYRGVQGGATAKFMFTTSSDGGLAFANNSTADILSWYSGSYTSTTALYRDVGWYHIVMKSVSGSGTVYVNGEAVLSSLTVNGADATMAIGSYNNGSNHLDGYMAEWVFIDGTAYNPTSFAEYDETGLYWTPKSSDDIKADLTFGTNGFYLNNTISPGIDEQADATLLDYETQFLCSFDGTDGATSATDESSNNATINFTNQAQLDTAQKKFGTASVLFDGSTDYLYWSDNSATDIGSKDFTIDCWVRFASASGAQQILGQWEASSSRYSFNFTKQASTLQFVTSINGSSVASTISETWSPSADTWYHVAVERTGGKIYLYVDGSMLGSGTANTDTLKNSSYVITMGATPGPTDSFNGWIDEMRWVVGTGAYGGASFTPETAAYSLPTGNHFINNNTVVTSTHTPTKSWPLLSYLVNQGFPGDTLNLSLGNSKTTYNGTTTTGIAISSMGFPGTGKFVVQCTVDDVQSNNIGWVCLNPDGGGMTSSTVFILNEARWISTTSGNWVHSQYVNFSGATNLGTVKTSASDGDVFQLEWDNGTLTVQINGTRYTPSGWTAVDTSKTWTFMSRCAGIGIETWDFGQNGFTPVDTSYSYLNTETLAAATTRTQSNPYEHWNNILYTGNGTAIASGGNAITGAGFAPDFAWLKARSVARSHSLYDIIRGATKPIVTNGTDGQTTDTESLTSFNADGFTVGSSNNMNISGATFVAWCAKLGGTPSTNEDGTIDSSVSVNQTLGMSVGTYTGNLSASQTIGHGLGVTPQMVLFKNTSVAGSWVVYHEALGNAQMVLLNVADAKQGSAGVWGSTSPTSSVLAVSNNASVNGSGNTMMFIAFAPSEYISIGSYEGNSNANGTFIPTLNSLGVPIQPFWWLHKCVDTGLSWYILDSTQQTYNVLGPQVLSPDTAEATPSTSANYREADFVTGGVKIRASGDQINNSNTHIYMTIGTPTLDVDGRIIAGR